MEKRPGSSRVICSTRQPGIGQSLFMLRSMGFDASPYKPQCRPTQSTQTAGEPLPHRPPDDTSDTLQVPSNLAGSARAEPDASTPALNASATTVFLIMDVFLSLMMPVRPGLADLLRGSRG